MRFTSPHRFRQGLALAAAALGVVLLSSGLAGAAVDEMTTLTLGSPEALPGGNHVLVEGSVRFGSDIFVAAEDPAGDAAGGAAAELLGTDIVGATISSDPAKPDRLRFVIDVTALPPVFAGMPEAVLYEWDILVDGEVPGPETGWGGIQWRRSNVYATLYEGLVPHAGVFLRTISCAGGICYFPHALAGGFDGAGSRLVADVPLQAIDARAGSEIEAGSAPAGGSIRSSLTTGPTGSWWFGGDDVIHEELWTVPTRKDSVRFAIVPSDAPEPAEFDFATTPDGDGAEGSFAAALPTAALDPGSYDIVARACWGSNCATTRVPLTVE